MQWGSVGICKLITLIDLRQGMVRYANYLSGFCLKANWHLFHARVTHNVIKLLMIHAGCSEVWCEGVALSGITCRVPTPLP